MYKNILIGASLLLLTACGTQTPTNTMQTGSVDTGLTQQQLTAQLTKTKIFLIDIDPNNTGTDIIGCGDHMAYLEYDMSQSQDPIYDTLSELLTLNPNDYAGYYNSLDQAELTIHSLSINNGVAEIYLNGTLNLGGECDNPRVVAQLEKTLLQFPNIQSTEIYINNTPLQQYISLK